ncbi:MAG: 3,5-cyclic adenosine monophosphate phosphodiesterase CpdA [Planctomycetota bacterium]|jgi:Icc protein
MALILQLSDLHLFSSPTSLLRSVATHETLLQVVRHIQDSGLCPDHVVITGDHTHDELPESYAAVADLVRPWRDRLWQIPGNHDDRQLLRQAFSDRIPPGSAEQPVTFSFEADGWLCLGLDTHLPGSVAGRIGAAQIDWARRVVQRSDTAHVLLFLHHPPLRIGSIWMDAIGLEGREMLEIWCHEEPRIKLICCGHVHHEFCARLGNAVVLSTPSTGVQFSPRGDAPTFVPGAPGFRIIQLSETGFHSHVERIGLLTVPTV